MATIIDPPNSVWPNGLKVDSEGYVTFYPLSTNKVDITTITWPDEGIEGAATTDENGTITVAPVPYYCKPVEVEQKEANWTDGEKYYIILGAQKIFGDDLSTYGMFTSIEDAAMNMGFTPYEYVEEETKTVEEN